jgi:hypothetical protein
MRKNGGLIVLLAACFLIGFAAVYASGARAQVSQKLEIDVPVKLEKAKVVFDIGHLVLNGDMPFFLGDMDLLVTDLRDWNVKAKLLLSFTETLPILC